MGKARSGGMNKSEQNRFERLVDSVKDFAVFMLNPDGTVATWNEGAHRIKQYECEEVMGQHFRMLYTPEDRQNGRPEKNLADATKYGQTKDMGWRQRRDGTRFWADVTIASVNDEQGKHMGFLKIIRDLTELNKAEAHARTLAVAHEMEKLKDQFLSIVSHELRTPLTAIKGFADLIDEEGVGPMNPEQHAFMKQILAGAERLTGLVDDLLDLTRLRFGDLRLVLEPYDFRDMVEGLFYAVQPMAERKSQWLSNHLSPELPRVVGDAKRIRQVLWNLLDNAVKFTSAGGRIEITARVKDGFLHCAVADTGRGIAAERLEDLFRRFEQGDMTLTRAEGGLGIGLALSRELVEAHGGRMGALSEPGKGSTFWFDLPIAGPKRD